MTNSLALPSLLALGQELVLEELLCRRPLLGVPSQYLANKGEQKKALVSPL